ncbi:uncharacterized protein [Rhodnius prolixus]|uniref:uncharacterized protein n=1 Tax=Rhodnius prolixus TaxID=13249 RepID=UPI003D189E11
MPKFFQVGFTTNYQIRKNAGAGVYGTNFQFSEPVGTWASNFDGEIRAILIGLRYLVERKFDQVVFLSDSQAALIAVTGAQSGVSADVRACQEMIEKILIEGKHLAFQWIPAHCGLPGNEQADNLAKQGSQCDQPDHAVCYASAKRVIGNHIMGKLHEEYRSMAAGKQWATLLENKIPAGLPRKESAGSSEKLQGTTIYKHTSTR